MSISFNVHAQYIRPIAFRTNNYKAIDSAQFQFTYLFKYKKSYSRNDSDTLPMLDKQSLLIGTHVSKYFSKYYFDSCDTPNGWLPSTEAACGFEIFKNYPDGKVRVNDHGPMVLLKASCQYVDTLPVFDWKMEEDTATILTYSCNKATTTYKGRNYTAWFASDIPISNGPWKFGGLPGLILKVKDDQNQFLFECIEIDQLKSKIPIKYHPMNYLVVKRGELDKIYRDYFKDPIGYISAVGSELRGQVTADMLPKKMSYNPLEIE